MTYVSKIVDAFGGVRPMATALKTPASTVMSWKVRGSIPDEHKRGVMAAANARGIQLQPADFFPSEAREAQAGAR